MPSSTTELIKGKLDIVDFLRGYLTLTPAGKNFRALCPFHHEKSPSFMVSPERGSWHCFGCGAGGDIFAFVMRYENIEFGEALRMLAEKAGVELRRENPAEYRYSGLLYDLNDAAKNFYKNALASAPVAKKYISERGLSLETVETFELGWAPNESEALSMHLLNAGSAPQDLLQAGLSIKTERGLMLDRFRGRIMFPIHNHVRKVVGFTGRILPQLDTSATAGPSGFVTAKYVNSPETPIFQKSKLLYGFWKTKDAVREAMSAVLVEGQMDFLMSWQSGVKNVVASSGTALTADHLRAIHRLAEELVVAFDGDAAGSDAALRAIDLAEANDFSVKVAVFKDFKDAAEAAQAAPENVAAAFAAAIPAPEFYFEKYLPAARGAGRAGTGDGGGPNDASGDAAAFDSAAALATREGLRRLRAVLAKLKSIASPVEREFWMNALSKRTGINEATLREESEKLGETPTAAGNTNPRTASKENEAEHRPAPRHTRIYEELLVAALSKNDFSLFDDCADFLDPPEKDILRILKSGKCGSDDPVLDAALALIVLRPPADRAPDEIASLKSELAKEYYKERRHVLTLAVKNAEARGNDAELRAALEELKSLPASSES